MDPEHSRKPSEAPTSQEVASPGEPAPLSRASSPEGVGNNPPTSTFAPKPHASSPEGVGKASTAAQEAPSGVSGLPPTLAPTTQPHAKPNWMVRLPENSLPAILGGVIVLLLGFALTQTNDRITETNDRITETNDRITRLEDKVDAGFAIIDERFAVQDAKFDEINLKLTALIAALNATAEVEAALDGRLLDPNAPPTDDPIN